MPQHSRSERSLTEPHSLRCGNRGHVVDEPSLGDAASFTVTYPSSLDRYQVSVQVLCYQEGAIVFATAGLHDRSFLLGGTSSPWLERGGAATCHADLY
jgi:hypothetical protein